MQNLLSKKYVSLETYNKNNQPVRTPVWFVIQNDLIYVITREKTGISKKGIVQTIPTSWQSLMGGPGQKIIKEGYKEDTGIDVADFEEELETLEEPIEGEIEDE